METRKNTKIKREITLIDTFNVEYKDYYKDFKANAEINGWEVRGKGDYMYAVRGGYNYTIGEYVAECISEDADEFWRDLQFVKETPYCDYYVVTGSLGLWTGRHYGICETFDSLYEAATKCATDAYDIIVKCDGKKIDFTTLHHDGRNIFEIRRITWDDKEKIDWWDNDKDGDVFDFIEKHAQPITYEMIGR